MKNEITKLNGTSAKKKKKIILSSEKIEAEFVGKQTEKKEKTLPFNKFIKVENYIRENYDIRYNVIANSLEYREKSTNEFKEMNENNVFCLLERINLPLSMAKLTSLLRSDFVNEYNPIEDYFKELPAWSDKEPDYINELANYIKFSTEEERKRFKIHFKKMFVRCVACALDDQVFNKQCFVFVHEKQNSGKSTLCRWFCPPKLQHYYSEYLAADKDSQIALCENMFINLDELACFSRLELNALKATFSKSFVKVRKPFDRKPSRMPRRCNFFGSTNKIEFLNDETGSVRWLCFVIESIDWDYAKNMDINKIWAQAYFLYWKGVKYELTADEIAENETANKEFQVSTPEMELIQKYYSPATKEKNNAFMTATEIANDLMNKHPQTKLYTTPLGKALKILGFARDQQRTDGVDYPLKGYYVCFKL